MLQLQQEVQIDGCVQKLFIPGIFCFVILPKLFFVCMHAQIMISIKKTSYYITVYNGKQFLGDLMN